MSENECLITFSTSMNIYEYNMKTFIEALNLTKTVYLLGLNVFWQGTIRPVVCDVHVVVGAGQEAV